MHSLINASVHGSSRLLVDEFISVIYGELPSLFVYVFRMGSLKIVYISRNTCCGGLSVSIVYKNCNLSTCTFSRAMMSQHNAISLLLCRSQIIEAH